MGRQSQQNSSAPVAAAAATLRSLFADTDPGEWVAPLTVLLLQFFVVVVVCFHTW